VVLTPAVLVDGRVVVTAAADVAELKSLLGAPA